MRRIKARKGKDGLYFLDYHCMQGVRHLERKISKQKKTAESWEGMRIKEFTQGICKICEARQRSSFKDVAGEYLDQQVLNGKKSLRTEQSIIKTLVKHFGNKAISEITVSDINLYKSERLKTRKNNTVNRELACLRQIYNHAIRELKLPGIENQVSQGVKFEKNTERLTYLIESEARALEETAYKRDQVKGLAVILAMRTGLRRSNLLGLKWSQVDLTADPVSVKIPGDKVKNKEDFFTYITDPGVIEKIRSLPSRMRFEYLFTDDRGNPYQSLLDFLKNCLREAGILKSNLPRLAGFCWHSLRHCFASLLVMKGVDLNTVREAGGWRTLKMVLRYAHLSPAHVQKALTALDGHKVSSICQGENEQKKVGSESL